MSFTPQPWRQVANEIVGPNGDVIADVTGGEGCRFVDDEDNIECLANARLIAAAPDMLESLRFVEKYIEMRADKGDSLPSQLCSSVRMAISKAVETEPQDCLQGAPCRWGPEFR